MRGHAAQALRVAVGEIRAHRAVRVDIDQSGDDAGSAEIDLAVALVGEDGGKAPVLHVEAAGDEALFAQEK